MSDRITLTTEEVELAIFEYVERRYGVNVRESCIVYDPDLRASSREPYKKYTYRQIHG